MFRNDQVFGVLDFFESPYTIRYLVQSVAAIAADFAQDVRGNAAGIKDITERQWTTVGLCFRACASFFASSARYSATSVNGFAAINPSILVRSMLLIRIGG